MQSPEARSLSPAREAGTDQRTGPRASVLIRAAKLVSDRGEEYLCVIRDVSAGGVRLRLFHPLAFDRPFSLELANGRRYGVERVWQRGEESGYSFASPVDVSELIAEPSAFTRRGLRLRIAFPVTVTCEDERLPGEIADISHDGARLRCSRALSIGQHVTIEAQGMPPISASVRWRRMPSHGLVFRDYFSFAELARFAREAQARLADRAAGQPGLKAMASPFMQ